MSEVRYIERDEAHLYRMMVAGRECVFGYPNGIWVDCIACGRRDRLTADESMSDEQARLRFERKGWSVRPTRCPDCNAAGVGVVRANDKQGDATT